MKHYVTISGHSRGLGLGLTHQFLNAGWQVWGISRKQIADHPALQQTGIDLSDAKALADWLSQPTWSDWLASAHIAILINNAGQVTPIAAGGRSTPAALAQAISLNVSAPLMLTDAFIKATTHCADRRVVHVSSGAARSAYAGWGTYCASKAALDHHARCLAAEIDASMHTGLTVSSIAPGVIDTDMQADLRSSDEADFPSRRRFIDMKAAGVLSSAESIARMLQRYVCSDAFGSDLTPDLRSISI